MCDALKLEEAIAALQVRVAKLEKALAREGITLPVCECGLVLSRRCCRGCRAAMCKNCNVYYFSADSYMSEYCSASCARRHWEDKYLGEMGSCPSKKTVRDFNAALEAEIANEPSKSESESKGD